MFNLGNLRRFSWGVRNFIALIRCYFNRCNSGVPYRFNANRPLYGQSVAQPRKLSSYTFDNLK